MSDPSIQTLCCQQPYLESPSLSILTELNSTSYNLVCLLSSLAGILGAAYQMLPRKETVLSRRWFSLTSLRGRHIIIWLAFADLLASLGLFLRSVVKLNDSLMMQGDENSRAFCIILAAWTEYFYVVTWAWTLIYALDTWLALQQRPGSPTLYHCIVWILPAIFTTIGLLMLYYPDADCHNTRGDAAIFLRLLPNYFVTYIPIATVMIACPVFYILSLRRIQELVSNCLGQVTKKERFVITTVQVRFGLISFAFYICWLPNLIHGIIVWISWYNLPRPFILTLIYAMAMLNPLQALFNSLVYKRSNMKVLIPFKTTVLDETTPLLEANINH